MLELVVASRQPAWTIAAFFGAVLFFLLTLAMQYARNWSFVERLYLPVYTKTWMHGLFPKAQTRYNLIAGVTAKGQPVKNRRVHIGFFLDWCHDRSITEPLDVTRPVLEQYQRHLFHYPQKNGNPLSFRSQHSRLVPIRVWFRWMARQRFILHNPASELELPRLCHRLPKHVLNVHEVEQVLAHPNIHDPLGLRDRALLETLYSTGMRSLELANLKLYDVDTERGTLMIRQGKGKKDRVIPIGDRAAAWLDKYIRESRAYLVVEPDDGTVFLSNAGEPFSLDHLSDLLRVDVDAALTVDGKPVNRRSAERVTCSAIRWRR